MIKLLKSILVYIQSRPLIKDTIFTSIWGTIGNAAGFFIPVFIAAYFGISQHTDAFFLAFSLIFFIANIFSQVLETLIVPYIAENKRKSGDIGNFIGRILATWTITFSVMLILFLLAIRTFLPFITPLTIQDMNLVYSLSIEIAPFAILMVVSSVLAGSINAYKLFAIPALSPAIRAIVVLIFIFSFSDKMGVSAIASGYVVGEIFRLVLLFFFIQRAKLFHIKLSLGIEPELINFLKTSSYLVIGMLLSSTIPLINRVMASWTGEGNVSLLEYAERLYMIPIIFLNSGLLVTILSHWSERYYIDAKNRFNSDVIRAIKIVGIFGIFFTACLFLFKGYLVNIVYGYGQFPKEQIVIVEDIFVFYLLGLIPYFLSLVYGRAFLTMKKTNVLFFIALFTIIGTIILNIIFLRLMGISGIALANSVVLFITFGICAVSFHKGGKR